MKIFKKIKVNRYNNEYTITRYIKFIITYFSWITCFLFVVSITRYLQMSVTKENNTLSTGR